MSRRCRWPASETLNTFGLMHRNKSEHYSITSSARASNVGGMAMPSALAVLRLTTSQKPVGNSIGRLPGAVPRRILSMK
jgi:uncharacterized membrane protein